MLELVIIVVLGSMYFVELKFYEIKLRCFKSLVFVRVLIYWNGSHVDHHSHAICCMWLLL
jgi:hypothetical protein